MKIPPPDNRPCRLGLKIRPMDGFGLVYIKIDGIIEKCNIPTAVSRFQSVSQCDLPVGEYLSAATAAKQKFAGTQTEQAHPTAFFQGQCAIVF